MRFRQHRGGYKESMDTTVEVHSMEELAKVISEIYGKDVKEFEFNHLGFDERNGWDSYYVYVKFFGGIGYNIAGISDNCLFIKEKPTHDDRKRIKATD